MLRTIERLANSRMYRIQTLLVAAALLTPHWMHAHPMGNFSINHYARITIEPDAVEVRYLIDMAEIPTFQEMQQAGIGPKADPAVTAYLAREAELLKRGLIIQANGRPISLRSVSRNVIFPPGAGGLSTMKLGLVYRGRFDDSHAAGRVALRFEDHNFPDRAGWKEIIVSAAPGITLTSSSVPEKGRSAELTNYPTDLLNSPPQDLNAQVSFFYSSSAQRVARTSANANSQSKQSIASAPQPAAPATIEAQAPRSLSTPLGANRQGTPRSAFTELVSRNDWGFWFLLTAALIAAGLGAFHALEPGHGKTMVAAYLVGSQGTAWHACILGLIVTASHTAGVYLLGLITLYASRYIVPEHLYPWLGVFSGLTIAGLGIYLLVQRYAGKGHSHHHSHEHHHHQHDHEHKHQSHDHHSDGHHGHHSHHHTHEIPAGVSYRQLLALGVTGGIVPCPAALVVLLSAVALHRIAFGLFLILAFSVGLAGVLIAIGLLMVYARRFMSRIRGEGPLITRWLPLASAAFITVLGFVVAFRALTAAGIIAVRI